MDVSIRQVNAGDAEGIVRILNPIIASREFTVFDTPFSVEAEREFIRNFPARGIFHVAIRDSDHAVIGFQTLEPFATYTGAFDHVGVMGTFVDLDLRRQRIARRLFDATFKIAPARGYEKIFTFVRADNQAALQTYLAQGFRIIGRAERQAKIDGRYVDEVLIEKLLDT